MRRRDIITFLGGAAAVWPLAVRAQQPAKTLKVGTVAGTPRSSPQWLAFERRMLELGYQEGRNFSFDFLQAASADEYEALYRKLAAREPDVILAIGSEIGLKSAVAVTRTVPIVMIAIDYDPLARGYVTSLARPSGNITGVVFQQIELVAKRNQLIKDGFPDSRSRPYSGTSCPQTNGKQRGAPPASSGCSFLGLNWASRLMTMRPRLIKHRSIIAMCS
jgi:putative ABC transport system substrate-binding protein